MGRPNDFLRDIFQGLEPDHIGALALVYQAGELPVPLELTSAERQELLALIGSSAERAARDILTLARMGRAFASFDALIARQGGQHVLYGSALVLATALQAWARHAGTPLIELARNVVR